MYCCCIQNTIINSRQAENCTCIHKTLTHSAKRRQPNRQTPSTGLWHHSSRGRAGQRGLDYAQHTVDWMNMVAAEGNNGQQTIYLSDWTTGTELIVAICRFKAEHSVINYYVAKGGRKKEKRKKEKEKKKRKKKKSKGEKPIIIRSNGMLTEDR